MKFNITIEDLRALNPCYDPATKLGAEFKGTLLDILNHNDISNEDKIWAVTKLLDEKTARLFAVYCAREALKNVKNPDERISKCIDVAERFAHGQATDEERSAAWSTARSAAESAAWSAAESAAEYAAWSAAQSAAWSAARSAAESAARYAAESAAWSAAESAAEYAAQSTARFAAQSAARSVQVKKLIEMVSYIQIQPSQLSERVARLEQREQMLSKALTGLLNIEAFGLKIRDSKLAAVIDALKIEKNYV